MAPFAPSQSVSKTNYGLGSPPFQLDRILGILFFAFVCFFQRKSDAKLRPMMSQTKTETSNPAFRSSRLDYSDCLFAYFLLLHTAHLNLTGSAVSSPPDGLHCLFVLFRIQFKVHVGTFKALHGQAAAYIRGLLQSCDARTPVLINRWLLVASRLKETVLLKLWGCRPKNVFPLNQRSLHTNRHKHTFEEQILGLNSDMFWDVTYPDWHCSFPEMTPSDAALYLLIFLFGCSQPDDLSNLSGQPHSLLCDGLWRRKTQVHASTTAPSSRKTVLRARFGIFYYRLSPAD